MRTLACPVELQAVPSERQEDATRLIDSSSDDGRCDVRWVLRNSGKVPGCSAHELWRVAHPYDLQGRPPQSRSPRQLSHGRRIAPSLTSGSIYSAVASSLSCYSPYSSHRPVPRS